VIATTLVLVAVFLPIAFIGSQVGRLFAEFGVAVAAAVLFSGVIALSLTPMLCSRLLRGHGPNGEAHGWFYTKTEPFFIWMTAVFARWLQVSLRYKSAVLLFGLCFALAGAWFYTQLQRELVPMEDRGIFTINMVPPVGYTPEYLKLYSAES
jgi:multidrug efflux pump